MFDFLEKQKLQDHHFEESAEWLIDQCIAKNLITLIWAKGGQGKSWLSAGIASCASKNGMSVVCLDYDSSQRSINERGIKPKLIDPNPKLIYLGRRSITMHPPEMLQSLEQQASDGRYKNTLIIFDSLRNFTEINNDSKSMAVMTQIMNLREAGATILILSHANKDGRNYQGSNNIYNSVDNIYHLQKIQAPEKHLKFILTVTKERVNIADTALTLCTDTLNLLPANLQEARLTEEEQDFIQSAKSVLIKSTGLNKKELLNEMGYEKTDKTAGDRLKQFEEIYWTAVKRKNVYTYTLI